MLEPKSFPSADLRWRGEIKFPEGELYARDISADVSSMYREGRFLFFFFFFVTDSDSLSPGFSLKITQYNLLLEISFLG
jgi:hypothetical protein